MDGNQRLKSILIAATIAFGWPMTSPIILAGEQAVRPPLCLRLVSKALEFELEGDPKYRAMTLEAALLCAPDCQQARWHAGQLEYLGEWAAIEEVMERGRQDELLGVYARRRDAASGDAKAEARLARWCEEQNFADRARLHWHRVVANPYTNERDLRVAVNALGLRQVGSMLLDQQEFDQAEQQSAQITREHKLWVERIDGLIQRMHSERDHKRTRALDEIRSIREPAAVAALELRLSPISDQAAFEVVGVLAQIAGVEASQSLVRHALGAPWRHVAEQAARALRARPKHEYAPVLLNALRSPIQTSFQITQRAGNLRYDRLLYAEGIKSNQLLALRYGANAVTTQAQVVDDRVRRILLTPGSGRRPTADVTTTLVGVDDQRMAGPVIARAQMQLRAHRDEQRLEATNKAISKHNRRIFTTLAIATEEVLPDRPTAWWDWWHEYNEVNDYYDAKPTNADFRWYEYAYRATYTEFYKREGWKEVIPSSCFRAGTPVWTETGLRPIESLQSGDRVLAQDPDSGALEFKLVIHRTVRPPRALMRLSFGADVVECTKGHPFWVNGIGWQMAKRVTEEVRLHTVGGPVSISSISELPYRDTAYNLVVDDFGTYFVGEQGALVHDGTFRKPTTAVVPGLTAQSATMH